MKSLVAATAASLIALSHSGGAAAQSFEVLRAGDSQMTCEAMTAEINTLNQTVRQQAEQAQRQAQRSAENRAQSARVGRGLLAGLRQGVQMAAMGNFNNGGAVSAAAAATAAGVAVNEMNTSDPNAGPAPVAPQVAAPDTPERQRAQHLTTMFGQRC